MVSHPPLQALSDSLSGRPAILVSGGPSLKKNIHLLKGREKNAVIIAVDTAVPRLLGQGIVPHFIVALDYKHRNADPLWGRWQELRDASLIFADLSTPYIPKFFQGAGQYYVIGESLVSGWFNKMLGETRQFYRASTVAQLGIFAAHTMGCDPVAMIGQDMAYGEEIDKERIEKEEMVPVPGVHGETLYTTPEFLSMIEFLESYIADLSGTFIDATEGGARIKGTEVSTLAEVLENYCAKPFDLPVLDDQVKLSERVHVCQEHLDQTHHKLTALLRECRLIVEKAGWAHEYLLSQQKSGGDFQISDELADAVNLVRQKHVYLLDPNNKNEWSEFTPILDTLMGETRFALHKQKIEWLKKFPEMTQGLTLSGLIWEMFSNKKNFEAMIEAAECFSGKIETARKRLQLLDSDGLVQPEGSEADLLEMGQVYLESMDVSLAQHCFQRILERGADNGAAHMGMGRVALAQRNSREAMEHFNKAITCQDSLKQQIDVILAEISAEYLAAAKDRIRRNRKGAEKFLQDILPEFPDYQQAQQLLKNPHEQLENVLPARSIGTPMDSGGRHTEAHSEAAHNAIWANNLKALSRTQLELYTKVQKHRCNQVGEIVQTRADCPTLQFNTAAQPPLLAYGFENPWNDAAVHLKSIEENSKGLVLFVGMGLGYGPLLVLRERGDISQMVICEPDLDLFHTALQYVDLCPLFESEKVSFIVDDLDLEGLEDCIGRQAAIQDTHFLRHVPSFLWKQEKYHFWDNKIFMLINHLNTQGGTTRVRGKKYFETRLRNMGMIRDWKRLESLRNRFHNKPAVIVAAGPSLDQSMPILKEVQGHCVLISVDSAVTPLINAGIMPDFVTTLDCQDVNFEKLTPLLGEKWPFSLVAMTKSTPLISQRIQTAHKFLAFQEDLPQLWIMKTFGVKAIVPAAFSVAHLNLGLALVLGADPIIFVGQDLAYTASNTDHAAGTRLVECVKNGLPAEKEVLYAPGVDGGQLPTDRGLISLKKLFEDIIAANQKKFLNATVRGLRIDGTESVDLQAARNLFMQEKFMVADVVEKSLGEKGNFPAKPFLKTCDKILKQIKSTKQSLSRSMSLTESAVEQLEKLSRKNVVADSFHDLPSSVASQIKKCNKANRDLDSLEDFWQHILELIYQVLTDTEEQRIANQKKRQSMPYLEWLTVELKRGLVVNQERAKALEVYWPALVNLETYLRKEGKLLADIAQDDQKYQLKQLIELYVHSGDYCRAQKILDETIGKAAGADTDFLLLQGEILTGFLDYDGADKCWEQIVDRQPSCAGRIKEIRHRSAQLWIEFLQEKGDLYPHLIAVWLGRVARLIRPGEKIPAVLLQEWRKNLSQVEELLAKDKVESALKILAPWEEIDSILPEVTFWKARCFHSQGESETAAMEMEKIVTAQPENGEWLSCSARFLLEAGRFDEGVTRLQQAVDVDSQHATLWFELGDALMQEADYASAVLAYERCFLALPDHIESLLKMGDAYLKNSQLDAAIAAYRGALQKDPENVMAQERVAMINGNEKDGA